MSPIRTGSKSLLIQNLRHDTITKMIIRVLVFLSSIITLRVLGLNYYGQLAFYMAIPPVITVLFKQGTEAALLRWLPSYKNINSNKIQRLVNLVFLYTLVVTLLGLPLFYIFHGAIATFFGLDTFTKEVAILLIIYMGAQVFGAPFSQFLKINYEYRFFNITELILTIVRLVAFYFIWAIGFLNVFTLLLLVTAEVLIKNIAITVRYIMVNGISWNISMPRNELKDFVYFSGIMFIDRLLDIFTSNRGVVFFIQLYLGSSALGVYRFFESLVSQAGSFVIPRTMITSINTYALEQYHKHGNHFLNQYLKKLLNLQWPSLFIVSIFIMANLPLFEKLYKVDLAPYVLFSILFILVGWFQGWLGIFPFVVHVYKKPEYLIYSKVVCFLIAITLYPIITQYGLELVMLAFLTIKIVEIGIYLKCIWKYNTEFFRWKKSFTMLIMYIGGIIIWGVFTAYLDNLLVSNFLLIVIVTIFLKFNIIPNELIEILLNVLHIKINKKRTGQSN